MDRLLNNLSFLIATDFDLSVFGQTGSVPNIYFGGWIVDRIPYNSNEMINDINRLGVNVLVVEVEEVPAIVFESCPGLEIVISMRANPVNVDLDAAEKNGVVVLHAPGRNAQAVAELTLCLILDLLRKVSAAFVDMGKGNWGVGEQDPYLRFRGRELFGAKVGLIGLGSIGQAVARALTGFSTEIIAFDPYQSTDVFADHNVRSVELDDLLEQADVISIHSPLNNETRDLLGDREFSLMQPHTIIINTARAAIINHDALVTGLENKLIAGAALDVHYHEPHLPDDPLYSFQNLLYTPHIGGATTEVITRGSEQVLNALIRYLNGEKPPWAAVLPENPRLKMGVD